MGDSSKQLGNVIKELREARGWSRSKLARRADISNSYVTFVEASDERADNIGRQTLEKIAGALEVTLVDLFVRAEAREENPTLELHRDTVPIVGIANDAHNKGPEIFLNDKNLPTSESGLLGRIMEIKRHSDENMYAVKLGDDSMSPMKKDWCVVASPSMEVKNHDLVIVFHKGKLWFRRVQINEGFWFFQTLSSSTDAFIIPKSELKMVHGVRGWWAG